ncbi:hypothetical protein B484DRAFT_452989 [Ochromonadaceae sp. CCMP2298]|nr:hypothetical protein B484DRAFT_452989 [Ochromonadaceae sp. CCMP2298]
MDGKEGYSTPAKAQRRNSGTHEGDRSCCDDCSMDKCAVCLSPLEKGRSGSADTKLPKCVIIETKCKHRFHDSCLESARRWKSECPMCRSVLTPLVVRNYTQSSYNREAIAAAASRARNAVRRRIASDISVATVLTAAAVTVS